MSVTTGEAGHGDRVAVDREVDVRLENVTKRFGEDVVAVDDVSLTIERGSFFALLGPSGCGKTTTLRMIGGFEEPTRGRSSWASAANIVYQRRREKAGVATKGTA